MSDRLNKQDISPVRVNARRMRSSSVAAAAGASLRALAEARWHAARVANGFESKNDLVSPVSSTKRKRSTTTARAKPVKKGMEATLKVMRLPVAEIDFFEKNPRTQINEKFDEIKESIRSRGIDQPIKVTKRPGASRYVLAAGGNTRLLAIKELHAETGDERFAATDCLWTEYVNDIDIEIAHTVENEQRAPMCFWDRANSYVNILNHVSDERGQKLSQQECLDYLAAKGAATSRGTLWNWRFATSNLCNLGAAAFLLSGEGTKAIQASFNKLQDVAKLLGLSDTLDIDHVLEAACLDTQLEFDRTGEFSADDLIARIYYHFGEKADIPPLGIDDGVELAEQYDDLSPEEFRILLVSRGRRAEEKLFKGKSGASTARKTASATRGRTPVPDASQFGSSHEPIEQTGSLEHLHQTIRELLKVALGNDQCFTENTQLPYGFFVDIPEQTQSLDVLACAVWWWLCEISCQGRDESIEVLQQSHFGNLCREQEEWRSVCEAEIGPSTNANVLMISAIDPNTAIGGNIILAINAMKLFRQTAPERFTSLSLSK